MAEHASVRKRKAPARAGASGEGDPEFEAWLDVRLKSLYDSVLEEPVPADMLKLLGEK